MGATESTMGVPFRWRSYGHHRTALRRAGVPVGCELLMNLLIIMPVTVVDLSRLTGVPVATMMAELAFQLRSTARITSELRVREIEFLAGRHGWNVIIKCGH